MKARVFLSVTFFLLYVLLFSCKKEQRKTNTEKAEIVVLAEITAGDSAIIPVGTTTTVGNGEVIAFEKLTDATVKITDASHGVTHLVYSNSVEFVNSPTATYTNAHSFEPGQIYSLTISRPDFDVLTASTLIPAAFSVEGIEFDNNEINGREVLQLTFTLNDAASQRNYYMFEAVKQLVDVRTSFVWQGKKYDYNTVYGKEVYDEASEQQDVEIISDTLLFNKFIRLNVYSSDPDTENDEFITYDSSFHRIFLTDSLFNGTNYLTSFAVDKTHFEAVSSGEKGRVLVRIKSISKELFDYLTLYEKYRSEFGVVPPANQSSPAGNINNGLGVFGGSYKNEWIFYYDEF